MPGNMPQRKRPAPGPFDAPGLEALALRYVERFQTTRARLMRYLAGKLRQRGWSGQAEPDLAALAERFVARGYIDEAAFAEQRSRGMKARGLGERRIRARLRADGVDPADDGLEEEEAVALALAFARRRRLGPFGPPSGDPRQFARQMAAMLRAGHAPSVARRVLGRNAGFDPLDEGDLTA